jgi:TetR/AcrR family transcriptional repressor of nem operon
MARASREQQELHRQEILRASSELFRRHGIAGTSVVDLMAAAGLTHGGFYGHFESKDALAAAVCEEAFDASVARWRQRAERAGGDGSTAFRAIVQAYLSPAARDKPGTACPATTLAADVTRADPAAPLREAYTRGVGGLVDVLAGLSGSGDEGLDRQRALVVLSTLVGAQMLARATAGHALSDEFLDAGCAALAPGPAASVAATAPAPARVRAPRSTRSTR